MVYMWQSVKRKTSSPRYIVSKNKKRMAVRVLLGVVVTEQHCLQLPPECQQRQSEDRHGKQHQ